MTIQSRDRRALAGLAVGAILALGVRFWPESAPAVVAPTANSTATAEIRLARLRESAATVSAKEEILKKVSADLSVREKGILKAETPAQAQAQLMQIIRRISSAEQPPLEIRSTELNGIRPFGDAYGEVSVAVQFDCKIDQLVNFLAALPAQPELIATNDLRVISANSKDKSVNVRVTVTGIVPRRLVPQKPKGSS